MIHDSTMLSIIVAIDEKRGIGKANQMMWHISEDFKRFKAITSGHPIIMGRKTFDSIGRVLPNRKNIVISRDSNYKVEGATVVSSLEQALEKAKESMLNTKYEISLDPLGPNTDKNEIFIIGGGQIFKEALEKGMVDKLYLTKVKGDYGADTFFPEYEKEFPKVISSETKSDEKYTYTFETRQR